MPTRIELPANGWRPRGYQCDLWRYLESGGKRAVTLWHRRSGKDEVALHWTACAAMQRVGNYWTMLPEASQARKAMWEAVNPHTGKRRVDDVFPGDLRAGMRNDEMSIKFKNGSTWQLVGSDNFDSLVGSSPVGMVFSEYALADPRSWAMLRPILAENGGWAIFPSTPRGNNHLKALYEAADADPEWFAERLTVEDTGLFGEEFLARELAEYQRENGREDGERLFRQEYYCSFSAAVRGAYYASYIEQARADKRIGRVPHDPKLEVRTAWDLGIGDSTAIWFFQQAGRETWLIDYYEASGVGLDHYVQMMRAKPYTYAQVAAILPHDAEAKELGTGKSRQEVLAGLGVRSEIAPRLSVDDGINAVRMLLPTCYIDAEKCARGIECLENYRAEFDERNKVLRSAPKHDWTSHCFVGETEALTRHGMCQIRNLPEQGEVLTPCGWKPYRNPRVTRTNAPLVEVAFVDGLTVRCTPDHLFLTVNGWKSAESLQKGSLIRSSLTRSRSISMAAFTAFGQVSAILLEAGKSFTVWFGRQPLGQSQLAAISTTEMRTLGTTQSATLNACRLQNTYLSQPRASWPRSLQALRPLASWLANVRESGISQKKAGFGIAGTRGEQRAGRSGSAKSAIASFAGTSLTRLFAKMGMHTNTADQTARPLSIVGVKRLKQREDVWCLTVPGEECFSLANGAVVHNCCDAVRYLAVSLRQKTSTPRVHRHARRPGFVV